jgi:hypothetical protein
MMQRMLLDKHRRHEVGCPTSLNKESQLRWLGYNNFDSVNSYHIVCDRIWEFQVMWSKIR